MAHLAVIYGTRPEWLKLASVCAALERRGHRVTAIQTGQHTDLLPLDARCDVLLQTARPEGSHDPWWYTALIEAQVREWLIRHSVDAVVVQGDTASAHAGALGAHGLGIRVAHVEAGVRTGDLRDPDPEEGFRHAIDGVATWHFPPTARQRFNLVDEGLAREPGDAPVVGNTIVDALYQYGYDRPRQTRVPRVLVTLHRREARGAGFREIVAGVVAAAREHRAVEFLWPTHPNGWAVAELEADPPPNLIRIPPVSHEAFLALLAASWAVLTDSGGVQEEAAVLGVEAVIARVTTDRPETVDAGFAVVTGYGRSRVAEAVEAALLLPVRRDGFPGYGDGRTGLAIADHLSEALP